MINIKSYAKSKNSNGNVTSSASTSTGSGGSTSTSGRAGQLDTVRFIWQHPFDGTQDVEGDLTVPNLTTTENVTVGGSVTLTSGAYLSDGGSLYIPNEGIDSEGTVHKSRTDIQSDNIYLGNDESTGTLKIKANTSADGHVIPYENISYDLGTNSLKWRSFHALDGYLKNLTVTGSAHFFELTIDKIKSAGGSVIFTPCDGFVTEIVEETTNGYKLYFKATDDQGKSRVSQWQVNDQALCRNFNEAKEGTTSDVSNKYYWCLVTSVSDSKNPVEKGDFKYHYIEISKTDCDGTVNPSEGDNIVMLGYRGTDDTARQSAVYISAYSSLDTGLKAPLLAYYRGINDFNLDTHRTSYWDVNGAKFVGNFELTNGKTVEQYMQEQIKEMQTYVTNRLDNLELSIPYIKATGITNDMAGARGELVIHDGESATTYYGSAGSYWACWTIDPYKMTKKEYEVFDMTDATNEPIIAWLNSHKNTQYIIAIVGDEGCYIGQLLNSILQEFGGCDLSQYCDVYSKRAFAFIGRYGIPNSTARVDLSKVFDGSTTHLLAEAATYIVDGNLDTSAGVYFSLDQVNNTLTSRITTTDGKVSQLQQKADSLGVSVGKINESISTISVTTDSITQQVKDMKTGLVKAGIDIDGATEKVTITGSVHVKNGDGVFVYDSNGKLKTQLASSEVGSYGSNTNEHSGTYTSTDYNSQIFYSGRSPFIFNNAKHEYTVTHGGATINTWHEIIIDGLNYAATVSITNLKITGAYLRGWSTAAGGNIEANRGAVTFITQGKNSSGEWVDLGTTTASYSAFKGGTITLQNVRTTGYSEYRIHYYPSTAVGFAQTLTGYFAMIGTISCAYNVKYSDVSVNKIGTDGMSFNAGSNKNLYFSSSEFALRWNGTFIHGASGGDLYFNTRGDQSVTQPLGNKIMYTYASTITDNIDPTQYNHYIQNSSSTYTYAILPVDSKYCSLSGYKVTVTHIGQGNCTVSQTYATHTNPRMVVNGQFTYYYTFSHKSVTFMLMDLNTVGGTWNINNVLWILTSQT